MTARIVSLYLWPVKGLSGQPLDEARIEPGKPLKDDRRWAMERSGHVFDPVHPRHIPKGKFLQLVNTAKLAALESRYDAGTATLTLLRDGQQLARGQLTTPAGRAIIEQFLSAFLEDEIPAPPRIVGHGEHHFFDVPKPWLSLINLETLKDIERIVGRPVEPERFRANVYIEGLPAWREFEWVGKEVLVNGTPAFRATERIGRCIATGVNPKTGERDLHIPRTLLDHYDHKDCGIYMEPIAEMVLKPGDELKPA